MDLSNITVNKQSSIRIAGTKILYFDPIEINSNANDADYIFITHEHFDHYEPASIAKLVNENTILIAPASMKKKVIAETKREESKCIFLEPAEVKNLEEITIEAIPAYNNLMPFHPKMNKWLGYLVTMDGIKYYVAGDTDANKDNKNVSCDVALIPVGGKFTMNHKDAATFVATIKPKAVIPTHYGEMVGKPTDGADFKKKVEELDETIQIETRL